LLKLKTPEDFEVFLDLLNKQQQNEKVEEEVKEVVKEIVNDLENIDKKKESRVNESDLEVGEMKDSKIIIEESFDQNQEFPEMIKKSIIPKEIRLSNEELRNLSVLQVDPSVDEPIMANLNCNTFKFLIEVENNDNENNTYWPIGSTLVCTMPENEAIRD
jgi:hypothetical protein